MPDTLRGTESETSDMVRLLERQQAAFRRDRPSDLATRRATLSRLRKAIVAHASTLAQAAAKDFGNRAEEETKLLDLAPTVQTIDYLDRNLRRFMAPERRRVSLPFLPGRARVHYQPLGVVGIMSPWNYPFGLSLAPLATALAAGNRAMLKPSEHTPASNAAIRAMLSDLFLEDQVALVEGGPEVGATFSELPFDHLIFTGGTEVGRKVMQAAARNLTPVTLELGGKSPAIIAPDADLGRAAASIIYGKLANCGQTCIAPDYVLVPQDRLDGFVSEARKAAQSFYPGGTEDRNLTSLIHKGHADRIAGLLSDAEKKGARVVPLLEGKAGGAGGEVAPALLLEVSPQMKVMKEEIFGPLLPVIPYNGIDEAIAHVAAGDRPLALYHFGPDDDAREAVLSRTTSGNVTVNDTLLHFAQEDLPFGGVGPSGIGAYHGPEGFRRMSHAKGVFTQARWNGAHLVRPPFGKWSERIIRYFLG